MSSDILDIFEKMMKEEEIEEEKIVEEDPLAR